MIFPKVRGRFRYAFYALAVSFLLAFSVGAEVEHPIFPLVQQLLDASPATAAKVEKILEQKLTTIRLSDENERSFDNFEAKGKKGVFRRLELHVPKARGGVSMIVDLRERPTRAEILQRFGPVKFPEYESGGKKMLAQNHKGQTLTWVLNDQMRAERLLIQDGR